jgi:hypothetical protein
MKILDDVPDDVLASLAATCGVRMAYDHTPGADEWTLSWTQPAGPIDMTVEYVGTRRSVCAFLMGYSAMQIQTRQILSDLDRAGHGLIHDVMRTRLGMEP